MRLKQGSSKLIFSGRVDAAIHHITWMRASLLAPILPCAQAGLSERLQRVRGASCPPILKYEIFVRVALL
jgi:hypothetical protein